MRRANILNKIYFRKPQRVEKISKFFADAAPDYFSGKLKNPFFIIGCNRSGTTLLVDTLAAQPEIASFPHEANELWHPQTFPWRYSIHKSYVPPIEVKPVEFTQLSLKYRSISEEKRLKAVFGAYQFIMGKDRFLNKSAMIALMIPYVLELFPQAKFIHIVRDGRGVARSWAKKLSKSIEENYELYKNQGFGITYSDLLKNCANSWKIHIEEIDRQKKELELEKKGLFLEFKYEDFCINPQDHLVQIAEFMGVSPEFFRGIDFKHITNMNFKYKKEFNQDELRDLTQIMTSSLDRWGYV